MKKQSRCCTVMIVPHSEEATYSLRLPLGAAQVAVILLAALLVAFLAMLYSYREAFSQIGDIHSLREQNRVQQDQINAYAYETQKLLDKIIKVEHLAEMVADRLGLEPDSSAAEPDTALWDDQYQHHRAYYTSRSFRVIDRTAQNIALLQQVIPEQTESLDTLKLEVEEYINRLAATPSIWPTWGRFTSGFGVRRDPFNPFITQFHRGVDLANNHGTPIVATANGTVSFSGYRAGHGNVLIISHGYGFSTLYAHLTRFAVREGARVSRGQVIGYMGSTGRSTGVHLHYEVHVNGVAVNPVNYMR